MDAGRGRSRALATSRWCHVGIALVVAISLGLQIGLILTGGADANSGDGGEKVGIPVRLWRLFSYFTIASNIVVMVVSAMLAADPLRTGRVWEIARLNSLLAITITGVVFATVLAPDLHLTGAALVATIGFHYVSPCAALLAWLLLGPRRRFDRWTVVGAFVPPLVWLVYIFAQGTVTDWYPYPFLDVTRLGLGPAVLNSLMVLVLGIVLAGVYGLIDAKAPTLLRDEVAPVTVR